MPWFCGLLLVTSTLVRVALPLNTKNERSYTLNPFAVLLLENELLEIVMFVMAAADPDGFLKGSSGGLAGLDLATNQIVGVGAELRRDQAWVLYLRSCDRDDEVHVQAAGGEQLAEGDDVLVADVPDDLALADRVEEMDVCPGETGRVRARELGHLQVGDALGWRQRGNGLRLVNESGRFRFKVESALAYWTIRVIQLTPEEAAAYSPKGAELD